MIADWQPDTCTALIAVIRGPHAATMGHLRDGKLHLLPEEALFLVDRGALQLRVGGASASFQHALTLALQAGVSLDDYLVYAHLKRLGYIVNRANLSWHELPSAPGSASSATGREPTAWRAFESCDSSVEWFDLQFAFCQTMPQRRRCHLVLPTAVPRRNPRGRRGPA